MSRIGKQIIKVPDNTTIENINGTISVKGIKGELNVTLPEGIVYVIENNEIIITRQNDDYKAVHGLFRSLLNNMIIGVTTGWQKDLEINGVGMRAALTPEGLNLSLGFSHPVLFSSPAGITLVVTKNVISVSGIDKQLVGETAAQIRKLKKPEPYKGKGIKYSTEKIRRKAGKTGKAGK